MDRTRAGRQQYRPRKLLRIGFLLLFAQITALGIQAALQVQKEQSLLIELIASRVSIEAGHIDAAFQRALASGLLLSEAQGLETLISRITDDDPDIDSMRIYGLRSDKPVFYTEDAPPEAEGLHQRLQQQQKQIHKFDEHERLHLGFPLHDTQGQVAGSLWFAVDTPILLNHDQHQKEAFLQLMQTVAGVVILLPIGILLCTRFGQQWALRSRLLCVALLVGLLSSLHLSMQAFPEIQSKLAPALDSKAETLANTLAGRITAALQLGIPLKELQGIEDYLQEAIQQHPEILRIQLATQRGELLYRSEAANPQALGTAQSAVIYDYNDEPIAEIRAWSNPTLVQQELGKLAFDLVILFLAALVLLNESMGAILSSRHLDHASSRLSNRLGLGRFAVFLLILSEEMTRAFLPLYIDELARERGFSDPSAIGLPISVYMASFALLTPFAGRWAERYGVRRIFSLGCMLSATGFAWALLDHRYESFTIARCLCAAGYAVGTMAMQQHFLRSSRPETRTRTLAMFVGAVQTAAICGAPLGGLLAEQFGPRAVFAGAAGMSAFAMLLQRIDRNSARVSESPAPALLASLKRTAVWVPLLTAALPAKLVLAGFLFYLTPLALQQESYGTATTGRAIMCYFLLVAAINPLASWLADRYGWGTSLILLGGTVIGGGGLAGLAGGVPAVFIGILALGAGTGLSAAALQASLSQQGPAAMVLLRTLERVGSVIGPMVAGLILSLRSYPEAMVAMGSLMLLATLALAIYQLSIHQPRNARCDASRT